MVNKPLIRPLIPGGGGVALGGVARIPMKIKDKLSLWDISNILFNES